MSNATLREALEALVRIHCDNEPDAFSLNDLRDALSKAKAALSADDAARGTMREQFDAWWQDAGPCMNVTGAEALMIWQASRAAAPQSVEPVAWVCATEDDPRRAIYWQADRPKFNSIDGEPFISKTALYLAPPVAPTDAEWQAEAMRLAQGLVTAWCKDDITGAADEALRAHIATRPLPAPPTKKEQP